MSAIEHHACDKEPRADEFEAAGHRLALELECLLMDCEDLSTVSKWFDTAHESLAQWRALNQQLHARPLSMP